VISRESVRIHPTADVSAQAEIGEGTSIWHQAQVREEVRIGRSCIIGKGSYVDAGVVMGDNVKVQNYVSIYYGVTLEDGVFCGPHCVFTNDKRPRAINADGTLKTADEWVLSETLVKKGAAIGANAVIVCGVTVGAWAMIGAGSVVTHDVPDHGLVCGNPARLIGFVCACGEPLRADKTTWGRREGERGRQGAGGTIMLRCQGCGTEIKVDKVDWESVE
jgi:UDP-3-O-[3-hydroxymyristoyl] glucosamine N-acyltransferase